MTAASLVQRGRASAPGSRRSRWGVAAAALLAIVSVSALGAGPTASAAPGDGVGCGYGTGGPFADTLCWIDMSGYVDATARSVDGQDLSATLPGGYAVSFTVRTSGSRAATASAFPTWEGAAVGNLIYTSTPGQPALYQLTGQGAASTTIELTDIEVVDSDDTPVVGWRLVGVDAEGTFGGAGQQESITFTSDAPVRTLATYAPSVDSNGCQVSVVQVDDNTITCTGDGDGPNYGTILVGATEPTTFSQTMTVSTGISREGVAFAVQTSTVSLATEVAGRADDDDSFDSAITSPESTVVGAASTDAADDASTGELVVLPRVDGGAYVLSVAGAAGTDLADYDLSWACTRDGTADPTLAATGVASIEVSPDAGEAIACTVTAAAASAPPTTPATPATPTRSPTNQLPFTG